jgi:hypothetical protein
MDIPCTLFHVPSCMVFNWEGSLRFENFVEVMEFVL